MLAPLGARAMDTLHNAQQLTCTGKFSEALVTLSRSSGSEASRSEIDIVRAELLERVGCPTESRAICDRLLNNRRTAPAHRSTCEFILGLISWEEGATDAAITHLQRAVTLAESVNDRWRTV